MSKTIKSKLRDFKLIRTKRGLILLKIQKININQKLSELVQIIIPIEDSNYSNIAVNESHEIPSISK